jgi:hypothetical protein
MFARHLDVQLSEELETGNLMLWCQFNSLKLQSWISAGPETLDELHNNTDKLLRIFCTKFIGACQWI